MLFSLQDTLIQMGNAPSLRNGELEQLRQFFGSLFRNRISPGPEGRQKFPVFVKYHVAVHHGADADGAYSGKLRPVFFLYVFCQAAVAVLEPGPDILQGVGPHSVLQTVFPVMGSGSDGLIVLAGEHRFDPGGSELNAQICFSS